MIVVSVLLALAANSWADAHKEHKLAVQARESFVQEIQANRSRVMQALPYHRALTDVVLLIDSTGGVPSYAAWRRRVPIWSGFAPPDIASTAWQSALATGALSRMPFREVARLSNVYTLQGRLDTFNAAYLPLFDFSDPAEDRRDQRAERPAGCLLDHDVEVGHRLARGILQNATTASGSNHLGQLGSDCSLRPGEQHRRPVGVQLFRTA
jgi:type II secretory pathway pseudopilin PulG